MTTIRHTEFRKYEKPSPKQQLVDIVGYFLGKMYIRIIRTRRKTLLYSTGTTINASRLISVYDHCYILVVSSRPVNRGDSPTPEKYFASLEKCVGHS